MSGRIVLGALVLTAIVAVALVVTGGAPDRARPSPAPRTLSVAPATGTHPPPPPAEPVSARPSDAAAEPDEVEAHPSPSVAARTRTWPAFHGRVVRAVDGSPIAGASVDEYRGSSREIRTDAGGRFTWVSPLDDVLVVRAAGHGPRFVRTPGPGTREDAPFEIRLDLGATLDVTLDDRRPTVGDRVVRAHFVSHGLATNLDRTVFDDVEAPVDATGRARIVDLPPNVELRIDLLENGEWIARHDSRLVLPPGGRRSIRWTIAPATRILGRLVRPDGTPMAGRGVSLFHGHPSAGLGGVRGYRDPDIRFRHETTDARGRVELRDVPPGTYSIGADANPSPVVELRVADPAPAVVEVEIPAPTGTLAGVVVDSSGAPVEGASVRLFTTETSDPSDRSYSVLDRTTAKDGTFRFEELWDGAYLATAARSYDAAPCAPVPASTGNHDVRFVLPSGATVSGVVRDSVSGAPVVARTVLCSPSTDWWPRGALDTAPLAKDFRFDDIGEGTYALFATTPDGRASLSAPFRLASGEHRADVTLTVAPGAVLRVEDEHDGVYAIRSRSMSLALGLPISGRSDPIVVPADTELTIRRRTPEKTLTVTLAPGEQRSVRFPGLGDE